MTEAKCEDTCCRPPVQVQGIEPRTASTPPPHSAHSTGGGKLRWSLPPSFGRHQAEPPHAFNHRQLPMHPPITQANRIARLCSHRSARDTLAFSFNTHSTAPAPATLTTRGTPGYIIARSARNRAHDVVYSTRSSVTPPVAKCGNTLPRDCQFCMFTECLIAMSGNGTWQGIFERN